MTQLQQPNQNRTHVVIRQPRRRRRRRFHAAWITVPATCLVTAYVMSQAEPSISFEGLMDHLGIHDRARFVQVAVLGVAVVAIVWITKIWRSN